MFVDGVGAVWAAVVFSLPTGVVYWCTGSSVAAKAIAGTVFFLWRILGRCGPEGARPAGWFESGAALPVQSPTFTVKQKSTTQNGCGPVMALPRVIRMERLRWEQRYEAAQLVGSAHRYTAAYTHIFAPLHPPDAGFGHRYTCAAQEQWRREEEEGTQETHKRTSSHATAEARAASVAWILERNISMLKSNRTMLAGVDAVRRLRMFLVPDVSPVDPTFPVS